MAALCAYAGSEERNAWPVRVEELDVAGHVVSWEAVGPLIFRDPTPDGGEGSMTGVRPVYVQTKDAAGVTREVDVVYPIFIYRNYGDFYRWSIFNLINWERPRKSVVGYRADQTKSFDAWPFWFSRQTGNPETSYHALFPVVGTIKDRLGYDRLSWVIWPLYFRTEKHGAVTYSTPWPFIRTTRGTETGFSLWPLFGWKDSPERFHQSFYLWPLGWNNTVQPQGLNPVGEGPMHQVGALPFYSRDQNEGFINVNYLWPFFGYTDRTIPTRYHETRYFWPFFVQGQGEHTVDRWAPFYSHSLKKGVDKTWIMWPIWRRAAWTESGVDQTKRQFLYIFYWSLEQRSTTNPYAAPADRMHVWPLFSKWDNGAGRKQFQLLSPFDIFFPTNTIVRETWTPLTAIYRSDTAPDRERWSVLWNAVTWRHEADEKEFHLGPLFSLQSGAATDRMAIGNGILGWKREPGSKRWRLFWFDFPSKPRKLSTASR